ncbi:MAG: GNAT family N-acetyltransferase [Thaumarchaeota archaeon]|nr:GNAT family N-acetyltransferase [Nitrososphaerota archaeon]
MRKTRSMIIVRTLTMEDIPKIIRLQKESFPYMASEGMIWKKGSLRSHIRIFPEGQFLAEYKGEVVGSSSSLIVRIKPKYREHTWLEICGGSKFKNHDPNGDTLYGADVSTHPRHRRLGIATAMYDARKKIAVRLNLKRIVAGGRLFNYCEYAEKLSPEEYVRLVLRGKIREPVLSFQIKNGFKFIKILPDYIHDSRSRNYATFIEWENPRYKRR